MQNSQLPPISNLWRIRRLIDKDTCVHAVRALIISRLDYCNSLLHGISKYDINRLQRLQNKATKLVFALGRRAACNPSTERPALASYGRKNQVQSFLAYLQVLAWPEPILPERSHGSLHTRTCWSSVRTLTPQGWLHQSMRLW